MTGSEEISVVPWKAEDFVSQRSWPLKSMIRSKIFSAGQWISAWAGMSGTGQPCPRGPALSTLPVAGPAGARIVSMATILAFHAHPDDEVLLTGGTLARLAAEVHRVVIVVACAGGLGRDVKADPETRLGELRVSASRLGAARVVYLGYADSGPGPVLFPDPPGQGRFARADLAEAAAKLADLIREEQADVLLSYDAQGGYQHRDQ